MQRYRKTRYVLPWPVLRGSGFVLVVLLAALAAGLAYDAPAAALCCLPPLWFCATVVVAFDSEQGKHS